jgi:hypothetical protein
MMGTQMGLASGSGRSVAVRAVSWVFTNGRHYRELQDKSWGDPPKWSSTLRLRQPNSTRRWPPPPFVPGLGYHSMEDRAAMVTAAAEAGIAAVFDAVSVTIE